MTTSLMAGALPKLDCPRWTRQAGDCVPSRQGHHEFWGPVPHVRRPLQDRSRPRAAETRGEDRFGRAQVGRGGMGCRVRSPRTHGRRVRESSPWSTTPTSPSGLQTAVSSPAPSTADPSKAPKTQQELSCAPVGRRGGDARQDGDGDRVFALVHSCEIRRDNLRQEFHAESPSEPVGKTEDKFAEALSLVSTPAAPSFARTVAYPSPRKR